MALSLLAPTRLCTFSGLSLPGRASSGGRVFGNVRCMTTVPKDCDQTIDRRSANYQPPIWEYDYVQSLSSTYVGETYRRRASELKEDVRMMIDKVEDPLYQLDFVDTLQRLGVSYHFEDEIKRVLDSIYYKKYKREKWSKRDLYATALEFRLLRQHGYYVSQEVFSDFKDETGKFKPFLSEDIKGVLYLYEASYLSMEGESMLDEARDFTTELLKENLEKNIDQNLSTLLSHALELPLHWRVPRLEARWFIDAYGRRRDMNATLLELAKVDFNMVQAIHQEDLKHMSRWWKSTGWGEKLSFARNRLMEYFLWTLGFSFKPQFGYARRMFTKIIALITTIDDVYDVYGTLDELTLFTDAIERWDMNAMERLPHYMKICFLGLYNSINEMAYDTLKEQSFYSIPYLKKVWADLCKSYLVEAKWYYTGYSPSLEEYMNNACISISVPVVLTHAYFLSTNPNTKEVLEWLEKYPNIIRSSAIIVRLADDLGTSSDELKRGDTPKAIQCYMRESGTSEEEAIKHIENVISETWKKMNEDQVGRGPLSKTFIETAINVTRMAQCMYKHGDGHGAQDLVLSLLVDPIP